MFLFSKAQTLLLKLKIKEEFGGTAQQKEKKWCKHLRPELSQELTFSKFSKLYLLNNLSKITSCFCSWYSGIHVILEWMNEWMNANQHVTESEPVFWFNDLIWKQSKERSVFFIGYNTTSLLHFPRTSSDWLFGASWHLLHQEVMAPSKTCLTDRRSFTTAGQNQVWSLFWNQFFNGFV